MNPYKCKVYKCKILMTSSKKYNIYEYYKIYIRYKKQLNYIYIRTFIERDNKIPSDLFMKSVIHHNSFYPKALFTSTSNKKECELTFYKYINIYPNIIKLFENKDEYSIRIGLEILKQELELNIQ